MKKILLFLIPLYSYILPSQCSYPIKITVLAWEGNGITIKWQCPKKPQIGQFDIYRTCYSIKKDKPKYIGSVAHNKIYEYSDNDTSLKTKYIYSYKVLYSHVKDRAVCADSARTLARPIDEDTPLLSLFIKNINSFTQKDIVSIKPLKSVTQTSVFLPIEIEIKDLNFDFQKTAYYAIVYGDIMIQTTSEENLNDFRYANIFIVKPTQIAQNLKIALVQGNTILGISSPINIEE
jgi:hypothetical protein